MDIASYIMPELLILVPVLLVIGRALKTSERYDNRRIPSYLGALGVILAVLYVAATSPVAGWQSALLAVFTAIVQGVLCAGAAVYGHQLVKQSREGKE